MSVGRVSADGGARHGAVHLATRAIADDNKLPTNFRHGGGWLAFKTKRYFGEGIWKDVEYGRRPGGVIRVEGREAKGVAVGVRFHLSISPFLFSRGV